MALHQQVRYATGTMLVFFMFSCSCLALGSFPGQFLYYSSYEYTNEKLRDIAGNGPSRPVGFIKGSFLQSEMK